MSSSCLVMLLPVLDERVEEMKTHDRVLVPEVLALSQPNLTSFNHYESARRT